MNWSEKIGLMFIACMVMMVTFHVTTQAEEYIVEDVPQDVGSVDVYNQTEQQQLSDILQRLDAILELHENEQIQAEEQNTVENEAPVPTADPYLPHLQNIEEQLADIKTNTVPATPETAETVPAFSVPFTEYSTTEALLLCLFVAGISCIVFAIVKEFT